MIASLDWVRIFAVMTIAAAAVTAVLFTNSSSSALPDPAPIYLALGDSLAASMQPDAHGVDRRTAAGYAEKVWSARAAVTPGLRLVKLGRGGETAATMVRSPRPGPSQLRQAEQQLRAAPGAFVTLEVGANEVERCHVGDAFAARCVERGLASIRRDLPRIISRLRAAGGDSVKIVGVNYYNSFLGRWVTGPEGRALALASVPVERSINATLARVYREQSVPLADAAALFQTGNLTRYVRTRAFGRVPLAVERTCRWTWACSSRYDDHTNALGYRVIARAVLARL